MNFVERIPLDQREYIILALISDKDLAYRITRRLLLENYFGMDHG